MNKQEFLTELRKGLSGLPQNDIEERLAFYGEMLDDRIEEGLSEDAAVAEIGDANEIVRQTVADIPLAKLAKERIKPKRRLKAWEIILLALGSPVWLSILTAAAAVIFSLYASVWAVIVSLWSVFVSLAVCAVGSVPLCVLLVAGGSGASGIVALSAGIICAGLSIFMFFGCRETARGILILTRKMTIGIKNRFIGKGEA